MAITGISEFTFGFAFLFEQTNRHWPGLRVAPILPSLRQEQEEGWDARLPLNGTDFYYQFKLSDYLWAGNAKYIKDGTYTQPYYRISLHKNNKSEQHNRLRQLAQTNPNTFYVAPQFNAIDDFNASFLARQITESSRLIPIRRCQDVTDSAQHYITYQAGVFQWTEWSEPKKHLKSDLGANLEEIYNRSRQNWNPIDIEFAANLYSATKTRIQRDVAKLNKTKKKLLVEDQIVQGMLAEDPIESRVGYIRRVSELVSTYYGATMVMVGDNPG